MCCRGAVTTFTGNSGLHLAQVRAGLYRGCVALETARDGRFVLRDSERVLRRGRWVAGVTERTRAVAQFAIPGDPVLEVAALMAADWRHRPSASSKCPFEGGIDELPSLGD